MAPGGSEDEGAGEPSPGGSPELRWSRRRFLAVAGAASIATVLAGCGGTQQDTVRRSRSDEARFRSRPDLHPPLVRTTQLGPTAPGYAFITPAGPLIVDDAGSPVWVHPVPYAATNLEVQQYRGEPVLTWWQGEIADYGVGLWGHNVIMDTSYRTIATVHPGRGLPSDLHEFTLTEDGTALLTAYTPMPADLSAVGGPKNGSLLDAVVQEVDVATGDVVMEWRSSDHIGLAESHAPYSPGHVFNPVHVNSISLTPDGNLLISARNTWALYKVDRRSGRILWRLGGKKSDFTLGTGVRFAWQHDSRWHPGDIVTVFDDEGDPPVGPRSRGLVLRVDEASRHVSLLKAYVHPHETLLAGSQGSVQLLADGHVLVGWGSEPYFTEFRRDGSMVLDAELATGTSYRAFRFDWTATPLEAPAVAAVRSGRSTTAYTSWNGATEVATWQALGGPDPAHLVTVGRAERQGFETAVPVDGSPAWVVAQALSTSGSVLAASTPTRVT